MPDAQPIAWKKLVKEGDAAAIQTLVNAQLHSTEPPSGAFKRELRQALSAFAKTDRVDCLAELLRLPQAEVLLVPNQFRESPLTKALKAGSAAAVAYLLRASDFQPGVDSNSPVFLAMKEAATNGHHLALRALFSSPLAKELVPPRLARWKQVALLETVRAGHLQGMRELLALGASARETPSTTTALMVAAQQGHVECLQELLPLSEPSAMDSGGKTAMHWAARHNRSAACLKLLLEHSDWMSKDTQGHTLLIAAVKGAEACVSTILQRIPMGSHVDTIDHCMVRAFSEGSVDAGQALLPRSTKGAAIDLEGHSAFMGAVIRRQVRSAQMALTFCDPKTPNFRKETALMHLATHSDNDEWFQTVLSRSDADACDENGRTAFDWALDRGRVRTLEDLAVAMNQLENSERALAKLRAHHPMRRTPELDVKIAALREQAALGDVLRPQNAPQTKATSSSLDAPIDSEETPERAEAGKTPNARSLHRRL